MNEVIKVKHEENDDAISRIQSIATHLRKQVGYKFVTEENEKQLNDSDQKMCISSDKKTTNIKTMLPDHDGQVSHPSQDMSLGILTPKIPNAVTNDERELKGNEFDDDHKPCLSQDFTKEVLPAVKKIMIELNMNCKEKDVDNRKVSHTSRSSSKNILIPELPLPSKRARNELTMEIKRKLLKEYDQDPRPTQAYLAQKYKIGRSTVSEIIQKKEYYQKNMKDGIVFGPDQVRFNRGSRFQELNRLMYDWFVQARGTDRPHNGPAIKARAKLLAEEMKVPDFKASDGWLSRWKQRYIYNKFNMSFKDDSLGCNDDKDDEVSTMILDCEDGDETNVVDPEVDEDELDVTEHPDNLSDEEYTPHSKKRKKKFRDYKALTEDLWETTSTPAKRVRNDLTIDEKRELILEYEQHPTLSQTHLAEKYKIGRSTVHDIIKNKEKYMTLTEDIASGDQKRCYHKSKFADMNKAVYTWFLESQNCSSKALRDKAKQIASEMNILDFKASGGWLTSWKKRFVLNRFNYSFNNSRFGSSLKSSSVGNDSLLIIDCNEDTEETIDDFIEGEVLSQKSTYVDVSHFIDGCINKLSTTENKVKKVSIFKDEKKDDKTPTELSKTEEELEISLQRVVESDSQLDQLSKQKDVKTNIIRSKLEEIYQLQGELKDLDSEEQKIMTENTQLKIKVNSLQETFKALQQKGHISENS